MSERLTHHAGAPLHPDNGQGWVSGPGAAEDGIGAQIHEQGLGLCCHPGSDCDGRKQEAALGTLFAAAPLPHPGCVPVLPQSPPAHSLTFQSFAFLGLGSGRKEETPLPSPSLPRAHRRSRQHQSWEKGTLALFVPGYALRALPSPSLCPGPGKPPSQFVGEGPSSCPRNLGPMICMSLSSSRLDAP